jgi:hypothetical protein
VIVSNLRREHVIVSNLRRQHVVPWGSERFGRNSISG